MNGDKADLQAQFSLAYVQAVASAAGYFVQIAGRGWDKDGVDVSVMRRGKKGAIASPRLDLQVKSRQGRAETSPILYDLDVKTYRELCSELYQVPRVLALVLVPDDAAEWLKHGEDEMALRRCAYWASFRGEPGTSNSAAKRVRIPREQVLDVNALQRLIESTAQGASQ